MSLRPFVEAVQTLRRVVGPHEADSPSDAALIARFAVDRDEDAFALLLRRHGPTVYGVCKRVLGNSHDADDAFQAVFVILARRAHGLRDPRSVGNWLYGVAVRVATKARIQAAKRRLQLMTAAKSGVIEDRPDLADLHRVLDEELARLPERYRAAVVLCDLNGKSRSVAAEELGIPEGTLGTRLVKAREMLAIRLRHRGVTLSVAGLTAVLTTDATAAVPPALAQLAMNAVRALPNASPAVLSLAQNDFPSLHVISQKLFVTLVVALSLVGTGLYVAFLKPVPAAAPAPPVPPNAPPEAKAEANAEGWNAVKTLDQVGWLPGSVAYSPDGKTLVVGGSNGHVSAYDAVGGKLFWEYHDGDHFAAVAFSRAQLERNDGAEIAVTFKDGVRFLDPKTGKVKKTLTDEGSAPMAVAFFRDGPSGRIENDPVRKVIFGNAHGYTVKTWLEWPKFGTIKTTTVEDEKKPADAYAVPLAIDPRGRAETHAIMTGPIDRKTGKNVLWAYSCGGPGGNHLLEGHKAIVVSAAWSADGKTAVTGDADGVVILWDTATFKEKSRVTFGGRVAALGLPPDGKRIAAACIAPTPGSLVAYTEDVYVWVAALPPAQPKPLSRQVAGGPFKGVASLAFAPDGRTLAAGFCNFDHLTKLGDLVGKVRIWSLDEPKKPEPNGKVPPRLHNPELAKFQGVWRIEQFDGPSGKLTPDEVGKLGWTFAVEGNKFEFAIPGQKTSFGRIAVDATQKPPVLIRIETDREQDLSTWCLYELDGDTLRLCQETLGKGKPAEFKVTASQTIAVYKREKPSPPPK